jgi:hypothetical protein
MKDPEKNNEPLIKTVIRTILTATIIAGILYLAHVFPYDGKSKLTLFAMIWLVVFCIVIGGHWLELLFINSIKFALPKNILLLYFTRIVYWFLCAVPLFFCTNFIMHVFLYDGLRLSHWFTFGIFYIGIELLMHAIMQIRYKKSFYNGVY